MSTTTQLSTLNINILTTEQYNGIADKDENELYFLTDASSFDSSLDSTSENAVQNKVTTSALNNKQPTITAGASTSGKVAVSTITSTELGYLSGVTSGIQAQLDNKQAAIGSAGDSDTPIYFSNGNPVACTGYMVKSDSNGYYIEI